MTSPVYVLPLYPVFHDLSGKPLEGGSIHIGEPGFAPESRPLAVYWDEANTLPAAQPIKTIAGYPSRNGSQAAIYVSGDYSITVRDKEGRIVYSALRGVNFAEAATAAAQAAAARAEAYADMMQYSRVTLFYSGTGTAAPFTMPITPDSELNLQLFVNGQRFYPGTHYTTSGNQILPTGDLDVWPVGVGNIMVLIDRPVDLAAPTSDDVTHDGQPISQILDRIDAQNTFYLSDYLHPDDYAAALIGNTASQNETRVTAAVQAWTAAAVSWGAAGDNRMVVLKAPAATIAINDEIFSEATAQIIWNMPWSRDKNRFILDCECTTIQVKNWISQSAVRTSGWWAAKGITYPVPKAIIRWEQESSRQYSLHIRGRLILRGAGLLTDPIGIKFLRTNVHEIDNVMLSELRNTGIFVENQFNSQWTNCELNECGFQPTEAGGDGFLSDTVRFSNTGAVVTATEPVFTSDHVGRWFGLEGAGPVQGTNMVYWAVIASYNSPTQITLATVPDNDVANVNATFEAVKASTTAGSADIVLSAPVSTDLVGRYVTLAGMTLDGLTVHDSQTESFTYTIIAHTGANITLSSAVKSTRANIGIAFSPAKVVGVTDEGYKNGLGRNDDVSFINERNENGWWSSSVQNIYCFGDTLHVVGGSKSHGTPPNRNNFGGNFANDIIGNINGLTISDYLCTHGGHSPRFGRFYFVGGRLNATISGRALDWPAGTHTASIYNDMLVTSFPCTVFWGVIEEYGLRASRELIRYGRGVPSQFLSLASDRRSADGTPIPSFPTHLTSLDVDGAIRQEAVHANVPALIQRSMRGSTSAKTAVRNNDVIGRWSVEPHDGTNHAEAGRWEFAATQHHTTSNKGTRAGLFVTQNNVSTPAQILTGRIGIDGNPRIEIGASGTAGIICGTGSPEGVVSAVVGSLFLRLDGGAGTSLYVKQSGAGWTGWVGK